MILCFTFTLLVVKVPKKTLLMDALKEETEIVYDFCMCNPPFFANQMEAKVLVSYFALVLTAVNIVRDHFLICQLSLTIASRASVCLHNG